MKKAVFLLLTFFGACFSVYGQVADGINYQAVALDEKGKEIPGHDITGMIIYGNQLVMRFSILSGSQDGEVLYCETHATFTDQYGLISLVIGHGDVLPDGTYSRINAIPWGADKLFLKVEIDIHNSGDFKLMSIEQMMAVPFALYALSSSGNTIVNYDDIINKPSFALVATTGNYSDLINKPASNATDWPQITSNPFSLNAAQNNQMIRFNASSGKWENWTPDFVAAVREAADEFTASAGQTTFVLSQVTAAGSKIKMFINGVRISNAAYGNSGTSLTYNSSNNGTYTLEAGDRIQFDYSY